jgi:hypothetical protein
MLNLKSIALGLFLLAAAVTGTACIFDKGGDYNGGGRRDVGAQFNESTTPQPGEDEGGSGEEEQDSGGNPLADVFPGTGGG